MSKIFHTLAGMRVSTSTDEWIVNGHLLVEFSRSDKPYCESFTFTEEELDQYIINLIHMKMEINGRLEG